MEKGCVCLSTVKNRVVVVVALVVTICGAGFIVVISDVVAVEVEIEVVGAGDRGRTGDIFLGKEALYH